MINFDDKTNRVVSEPYKLTLKARTDSIVELPTTSKGHGIIPKREIVPGVYLAKSLTRESNGYCVTGIVNMLGEDIMIDSPHVELEETENDYDDTVIFLNTELRIVVGCLNYVKN
jgi:hypothetical protein